MQKNILRYNLSLLFARIILCFSFAIVINCKPQTDFERNIAFDSGWQEIDGGNSTQEFNSFRNDFKLDKQKDKVYLLQVSPTKNVIQLRVNNATVSGNTHKKDEISFNITKQLEENNTIELISKSSNFETKLHCVNKLFIPDVEIQFYGESAVTDVKVKNAFNTEKQATLEYNIYSGENKKLVKKVTPVFVSGNAENLYRQEFKINLDTMNDGSLSVVCKLYSDGKLIDKNFDDL